MKEDKLDQWIKEALEENIEEEIRLLEANWKESYEEEYAPSPETDQAILEAIRGKKKRSPLKKVASILLISSVSLLGILALNKDVRAQTLSYFEEWFSDHMAIHFTQKEQVEDKDWTIGYIPEGYEYTKQEALDEGYHVLFYKNKENMEMTFEYVRKDGVFTVGQDNENGIIKRIEVDNTEALVYISSRSDFSNSIIVDKDDYVLIIDGFLSEKELIKIAKSIEEKK